MSPAFAAVDLGATSGRVIVGRITPGRLELREAARFPNDPVVLPDGLHWDITGLYRAVTGGLAAAERADPGAIVSAGIDSWAVDYGLLRGGRLLGLPYHYRDGRCARGVARVHARITPEDLYARTGLQHLPFSTVYQLACEDGLLDAADTIALIPDLLGYWLTGTLAAERTNASTTGLLDVRTRGWDFELSEKAGIPGRLLPPLADPGAVTGRTREPVTARVGRALSLVTVGSHDTASAVAAVPARGRDFAYISCGTWGLAGLELDRPVLTGGARAANFTNEGGVDGRIRFLRNVTGLWLLSESVRTWNEPGLEPLLGAAARVAGPVPVFDVDDPRFLPPGDIPARIDAWFAERDAEGPRTRPEYVRSVIESLAAGFARAVADASRLSGQPARVIHLVGGGARNALLCQATADRSGLPVLAGPAEATAIGNILVQARAHGAIGGGLEAMRGLAGAAFPPVRYDPRA